MDVPKAGNTLQDHGVHLGIVINLFYLMLKKAAGCVLASLRGTTYKKEHASPPHSLRPLSTTFFEHHPGNRLAY